MAVAIRLGWMMVHRKRQKHNIRFAKASVKVVENPAQPGHYKSVVFLRPHFQLDELSVSLRLVTELPQSSN